MKLTKEFLYEQYIVQDKSAMQIAKEFSVSKNTVAHKLSDLGIKKGPKTGPYQNKERLYEQFITLNRSQSDIAKECNVAQGTIDRYCEIFGIEKNKNWVFTKEFLYEEHVIKHKNMRQIAKETGHNNVTVRRYLDLYEIPVWTCHDNTNEYIDNHDGSTSVKVFDAYGEYKGEFVIDTTDVEKIKSTKWILVIDNIVPERIRYRVVTGSHPSIVLGRFLLNVKDPFVVDHIDNNPLNNRRSNLRISNRSGNQSNHDLHRNNTSGIVGITWNARDKNWAAQIVSKRTNYHLGHYKDKNEAIVARYYAEQLLFKDFRSDRNDDVILEALNNCKRAKEIKQDVFMRIQKTKERKTKETA